LQTFETAAPGTDIIRSVTLLHERYYGASPLHHTVGPLVQPWRTNVPTPHSAFIKQWASEHFLHAVSESTVAELFLFENAKLAKKLEIYVWTVEQAIRDWSALHYAFLLQVVDV
jgi:hypothetical protein